jgi:hypothetical protein
MLQDFGTAVQSNLLDHQSRLPPGHRKPYECKGGQNQNPFAKGNQNLKLQIEKVWEI